MSGSSVVCKTLQNVYDDVPVLLLVLIASVQPTPAPSPAPAWTTDQWAVFWAIVSVVVALIGIAVPILIQRRKDRRQAENGNQEDQRVTYAIDEMLDAFKGFSAAANALDYGTLTREQLDDLHLKERSDKLENLLGRGPLVPYFTQEQKMVVAAIRLIAIAVPALPSRTQVRTSLRRWNTEENEEPMYSLLVDFLHCASAQQQAATRIRESVRVLEKALSQAFEE